MLRNLIRLDVSAKERLREDKKEHTKNKVLYLSSLMGLIYALLGLMLLMIGGYQLDLQDNSVVLMSFVLISIGLLTTVFSTLFRTVLKTKQRNSPNHTKTISPYEVVDRWKEIEALIIQLNPNKDRMSLHSMISNLHEVGILSEQDSETINELLLARTAIVHTRKADLMLSPKELRMRLIEAEEIISRLKKLV